MRIILWSLKEEIKEFEGRGNGRSRESFDGIVGDQLNQIKNMKCTLRFVGLFIGNEWKFA